MQLESNARVLCDLLTDSAASLPLAYASWKDCGDLVFLSNKMKQMISSPTNLMDSYDFVKLMQKTFGSFLNTAVDKIAENVDAKSEFSSTVNILGENFSLKLVLDREKRVYTFFVEASKKPDIKKDSSEFSKILDDLPIYVWQKNKDLQIIYCNKAYADALETTQEYVIANNVKLIAQSRKDSVYVDQNLYSSKIKRITEHVVIGDARRLLSIIETPFVGRNISTGIAIDITDKETIERDYSNYKKQTEEALDNISIPIAIFDQKSTLVFANAAVIKLFSIEKLDLYNDCGFMDIMDYLISNESLISTQDIIRYKEDAMELFRTIMEPYHTHIHLRNGRTMDVVISPNPGGGLIFIFEDISDKVALEREVNSMSAVQTETLQRLEEGVLVFGADNRIKIANPAIAEIWGETPGKHAVGMHIKNFFEAVVKLFDSEIALDSWVSRLINMSAQRVEFSDVIFLSSGKTINYSYIPLPEGLNLLRFINATDSANLEKALKEKTDMISQIDKLKSNLISNISYELRAPLNTITGFAEILCKQYFGDLNDRQMEYCNGISKSVERVADVVEAIINLASIEAGQIKMKYAEVNVLSFINDLIHLFEDRTQEQGVSLKTDFSDAEMVVFIDEPSMKRAIFQLLSKAIRVTPSGGTVSISIELPESNPDYFVFVVSDTGVGLSEEDLERTRKMLLNDLDNGAVDNSIEFGIVLANNIVRLHNGKVQVESPEGGGTTVRCILPIKQFLQ